MRACADELAVDPRHVADPAWTIELARDETNLLGFVAVSFDAQPAELEAMFVAPEALGRRLGEHLMTRALVACARRGRSSLSIQSDPNAEDFYCRMGAVRVGRQESASIAGRFLPRLVLPLEAMTIGSRTHALWIRPVSRSICGAGMEVLVDGRVIGRLDTPSTDGAADSCVVDWPGGAAIAARIDGLRSRRVGLAHE
ncbi:MAG: GNAT family N-acetyltransferase [Burkholderiaceae bacterium]